MRKILSLSFVLLLGCATTIPKTELMPKSEKHGILAVAINLHDMSNQLFYNCQDVYFVKIDNPNDYAKGKTVVKSNYYNRYYSYLINVEPGKYSLVACTFRKDDIVGYVFLEDINIKNNVFEVKDGEITYIGTYKIDLFTKGLFGKKPDKTQKHFQKRVHALSDANPNTIEYLGFTNTPSVKATQEDEEEEIEEGDYIKLSVADTITKTEREVFINNALKTFEKTDWKQRLETFKMSINSSNKK